MMELRLIDANALKDSHIDCPEHISFFDFGEMVERFLQTIDEQPTVDAVPIGTVEQISWERDMAMQQLSEHGIPFGGNADDVIKVCRCKDCQWFDANSDYYDSYCDKNGIGVEEDFFCADGERRSDGEQ